MKPFNQEFSRYSHATMEKITPAMVQAVTHVCWSQTKKYKGNYDHLHLEIRKSFYDYGCASWLTMNKTDLNVLFYDPMVFMKNNLGKVSHVAVKQQ